jgi:cytochrome c biogenesis protein CcdA
VSGGLLANRIEETGIDVNRARLIHHHPGQTGPGVGASTRAPSGRSLFAIGAIALAYVAVLGAAMLARESTAQVTGNVEQASSTLGGALSTVGIYLPFGWAFGAGMVAAVNPCGFAMLPAYLGLFLNAEAGAAAARSTRTPLGSALRVSLAMTAGFVLLFGSTGLVISLTAAAIGGALPWAGLAVGTLLVLFSGLLLSGATLYSATGERIAGRLGLAGGGASLRGYLVYGLAYATASLGCTLPIFLAVVGGTLTASGLLDSLAQFVLYALGMGLVIVALTLTMALFASAGVRRARQLGRYVQPISALFMLLAGAYVMYYWLTLGGLLSRIGSITAVVGWLA